MKNTVGSSLVVEVPGPVGTAEVTALVVPTSTEVALITNGTEAVAVPVPVAMAAVKVAAGLARASATADWELTDWFTMPGQLAAHAVATWMFTTMAWICSWESPEVLMLVVPGTRVTCTVVVTSGTTMP